MRAGIGDVIDIEARVDFESSVIDIVEDIARIVWRSERIGKDREWPWRRWELQILVVIVCIATGVCFGANGLHEGLVEEEQVRPVFNEWNDDNYSVLVDAFPCDTPGTHPLAAQSHHQELGR